MTDLTDQINQDELNCPACEDQAMMLVHSASSEEMTEGVAITCPDCGFSILGPDPQMVERSVRALWDYIVVEVDHG